MTVELKNEEDQVRAAPRDNPESLSNHTMSEHGSKSPSTGPRAAVVCAGYLRADRTIRHALVSTALLRDPEDRPLHLVAHVVDITEQVIAEQRLVDLLASKDELIASVSHELRTPLTAVVGYAQMLNDQASHLSGVERNEMVASIVSQGTDLTNIIEDLLVEARADTGVLTVARVIVDLRAETTQVLETLNQNANGHHIELTGPPIQALADPARVRQILRNLISNAFRYGGDHIRIAVDDRVSSVQLVVSDNGPGVPPEDQDLIFEPYHRAHTRIGLTASVGLGLTVSRKLARLMDGDLTYRYQPGKASSSSTYPNPTDKVVEIPPGSRRHQLNVMSWQWYGDDSILSSTRIGAVGARNLPVDHF